MKIRILKCLSSLNGISDGILISSEYVLLVKILPVHAAARIIVKVKNNKKEEQDIQNSSG